VNDLLNLESSVDHLLGAVFQFMTEHFEFYTESLYDFVIAETDNFLDLKEIVKEIKEKYQYVD